VADRPLLSSNCDHSQPEERPSYRKPYLANSAIIPYLRSYILRRLWRLSTSYAASPVSIPLRPFLKARRGICGDSEFRVLRVSLSFARRAARSPGVRPCWHVTVPVLLLGSLQGAYGQSHGYTFTGATIGEGSLDPGFRYGVGGSWAVAPYVTAGAEVGGIQIEGASGAIVSGNVGVHFRRRVETGFGPFVTGGITGVRSGGGETALFANIGGGINYWFRPRVGFRTEFRGYPRGRDLNSFSELRVGISFR